MSIASGSIIIQNRPRSPTVEEHRIRRQIAQIDEEVLVGLLLAVAVHDDRNGLGHFARSESEHASLGDVVVVALARTLPQPVSIQRVRVLNRTRRENDEIRPPFGEEKR